jgi:hypothetical protein
MKPGALLADHLRVTFDLSVDPFQWVGRLALGPARDGERREGGKRGPGVEQHGGHVGELALQASSPLRADAW